MPGHDLPLLEETFRRALALPGPVIVHVRTQKGKGYRPGRGRPDLVPRRGTAADRRRRRRPTRTTASASADVERRPDGLGGRGGLAGDRRSARPRRAPRRPRRSWPTAGRHAHDSRGRRASRRPAQAAERARRRPTTRRSSPRSWSSSARRTAGSSAITAGMPTGTGLAKFQAQYPERFIDVGIAEQHAVTLATGLALGGMRPVVALYSTFLQRAFDQTVHDVCQNDAPVLLAVDRAGLVGEDGTSHQGMFTIPAQRMLPNLVIASPRDEQELRSLLRTALAQDHPFALHYPRDAGFGVPEREPEVLPVGRGEVLREGRDLLFVTFGPITGRAPRGRRRARGARLVRRRHQRPVRQAARPPADPRPGARQVARRDVRGERRDRRVRVRGARGVRGGAARRSVLPLDPGAHPSASRATGSSTTGR